MPLGLVLIAVAWGGPPVGGAGALAGTGEALGEAVVVGVETHPEYERYALRQPDGGVSVFEVTTGEGGLCDARGLTVFPRPDLAEGGEAGDAGAATLCERLAERPLALRERIGPDGAGGGEGNAPDGAGGSGPGGVRGSGPDGTPEGWPGGGPDAGSPGSEALRAKPRIGPLHAVLAVLLGLCAWRARPTRLTIGVGIVALLVRLVASPWGIANGNLAGYEKLLLARGTTENPPYGPGWGVLHGLVPGWPDAVFAVDLALGALSAALLAALVEGGFGRRARGGRTKLPAVAAGLFLALLPTHVQVSASETMHVPVLAFELVAMCGATGFARGGRLADGLIAALATGFAAFLRPEVLLFAPVPVLAVLVTRPRVHASRWLAPGFALVALLAWCVATLGSAPRMGAGSLLQLPDPTVLLPRFGEPRKEASFLTFLHAGFTPPALWGLAAVGAVVLWRARRRELALLGAWILVTNLPLSAKAWPLVDAVRLQLSGQAPWLVLAAVGAAALPRWVLPAALLTFAPHFPIRPWVQTEEWRFLREVVPTLPAGEIVRYDPRPQRARSFQAVMDALGPARWSANEGQLRYVGLDCRARGGCEPSGCVAERITRLEGRVDLDLTLEDRTIGFWRCPE